MKTNLTYKIDEKDIKMLVSTAKDKYFYLNPPLFVNFKELERGELPSIAMLEAAIMFLNSKGLLTKLVEIDYTMEYMDNDSVELEIKAK